MLDPVLTQLAERRRKAQQRVQRGKAIVERGNAELAECDRFEQFYRSAIGSKQAGETVDVAEVVASTPPTDSASAERELISLIARQRSQATLKAAILDILKQHPEGLLSGDLLQELRTNGYPTLLRTSMSPQLSRMKGHQVENIDGRWIAKHGDTAQPQGLGGIFD